MKILMFGWELPPFNSGGLGVACYGLSEALSKNHEILFVLPYQVDVDAKFLKLIFANENMKDATINSLISAYITSHEYNMLKKDNISYGADLFEEVKRYAQKAKEIALKEDFDVIHAHDWLSFPAGVFAKEVSGKPLVVQVHATEYDRTGGSNINKRVFLIEKEGMERADKIIAVSNHTKKIIEEKYGINPKKISVVHNRINADKFNDEKDKTIFEIKKDGKKIVLFAGRITLQKGPEYFLKVARKVLEYEKNVLFIMAGSGDMQRQMIEDAAVMGISDKVVFTGFLRGKKLIDIYKMADVFVMPSVSEPFGIAALESILHGAPVIISKQSGVGEVVQNAMKVDFWDVDEMTNKILAVLKYPSLHKTLKENGKKEIGNFSWDFAAKECMDVYQQMLTK